MTQIVLDNQFSDLDQLSADTRAWDLSFRLMQKGGFAGRIRQAASSDLLLTYAQFGSKLHQAGTTPPGFRTFALPNVHCRGFWWLGYEIDRESILRFGTDSELACVSNEDFSVYTLSVRGESLETLSEALGVSCPTSDRGVTRIAPRYMRMLLALAQTAVFEPISIVRANAAHELLECLLTYCAGGQDLPRPKLRSRDRAIQRVVSFLSEADGVQPNLAELCGIAHVSERTLQYAFRERYGVSPNQFVRCWQLNAACRLIQSSARSELTVAAIAAECGFLDPSVFAKHYRWLHGELPSTTVARISGEAGPSTDSANLRF